jgi:hypothetical protein
MKLFIKKLLRESLLQEKLTNVDDDVDLLYNKYFKHDIDKIMKTGIVEADMFKPFVTNTSILISKDSVRANEINQCEISVNEKTNYYRPDKQIIGISINLSALNHVLEFNGNILEAANYLGDNRQKNNLINEFKEEKIKGSIHHELAHWIDDTFNNKHIQKTLKKAMEYKTKDLNGVPVNASKIEIQGQIHNIKQLFNKYYNIWDNISFDELIKMSPSLSYVYNNLQQPFKDKWIREIKLRMHREKLLGKKMYNEKIN